MREVVEEPPWSVVLAELEKDPLTRLADAQDGVVAAWQLDGLLTEKAVRHRLSSGRWRRVHRLLYLTHGGPIGLAQRRWIAVLAATPDAASWRQDPACLAGLSALQVHGLKRIDATGVHVLIPAWRRVRVPVGVIAHRARTYTSGDRFPLPGIPLTTVGRAVVEAAAWARSDDEARLVIAASFQQRLVGEAEVAAVVERMSNVPRRRLILVTAHDAAGGSHSLGELDLVKICRAANLPVPTRQVMVRDSTGRRRYLDAVFDPWKVAVEIDGSQHARVEQAWDDSARQNDLVLAQYIVLRFPVHVVRTQPQKVAAAIRQALLNAGWRP